jgi:hypothetical protein
METKRLSVSVAYTFVGNVDVDVPLELLKGKSEDEQMQIAYDYAQSQIDEIPVASDAVYIPGSDNFEMEDIHWEE